MDGDQELDWDGLGKKEFLSIIGGAIFISFMVGFSAGDWASDDPVEQGLNEVCYKFGAEATEGVSFIGTSENGNLTVRCKIGKIDPAVEEYEISIPVYEAKTRIVDPTDNADKGGD